MPKYVPLNDAIGEYLERHRYDHESPHYENLRRETEERFGEQAIMQIGADQGAFLSLLVGLMRPAVAVEVGTFTGYSAHCIARALPEDGHLYCFDISDEFTSLAREFWRTTDVADRVTLRLGPATETLDELGDAQVGFAFIDADKTGYDGYFEALLPRMATGGLFVFDNMLSSGRVVDESHQDDNVRAIRTLNAKLVADDRVEATLIAVGDGLLLARKR